MCVETDRYARQRLPTPCLCIIQVLNTVYAFEILIFTARGHSYYLRI